MAQDIVIPTVGESVTSGVIAAWTKDDGAWVERDETVIELETDKITMEIPAPASGLLRRRAAVGETVDVGAIVGSIDESASKPAGGGKGKSEPREEQAKIADKPRGEDSQPVAAPAIQEAVRPEPEEGDNGDLRVTPLARKLAQENRIDLHGIRGTGPGGRIREQDVLAALHGGEGHTPAAAVPQVAARASTVERMSPMRQRIASRLVEAQQTAAMLTTFNEVDMTAVMDTRKRYKDAFSEKHGVGLGFMSFFVKAAVGALRAFPVINAYIVADAEGKPAIERHEFQDIAIAVSSPKGLVVPVLRNAERMSFAEIESAIKDYGARAQSGKLSLEEMQGGTFTITNGGVFGSLVSTPILNPPQSAILGMHAIKNRAVEDPDRPGQIALRPMMFLALSYDHRIVDGADAVRFLVHIKNSLEDPKRLLLEL